MAHVLYIFKVLKDMQGGIIMELEVLDAYELFEIHSVVPKMMCKLKNYIIQDGFLIFYTGKNPGLSVNFASFPLDQIAVKVEAINDDLDRVSIFQEDHNRTHIVFAHKRKLEH